MFWLLKWNHFLAFFCCVTKLINKASGWMGKGGSQINTSEYYQLHVFHTEWWLPFIGCQSPDNQWTSILKTNIPNFKQK